MKNYKVSTVSYMWLLLLFFFSSCVVDAFSNIRDVPAFANLRNSQYIEKSTNNKRQLKLLENNRFYHPSYISSSTLLTMGFEIKIRIVGRKNGCEPWLNEAYEMYVKRLRSSQMNVGTVWHKTNNELVKGVAADRHKRQSIVLLDPQGLKRTSEEFSEDVYRWLEEGGSRLSFVIGGAEGLPPELKYGGNEFRGGANGKASSRNVSIDKSQMISLSTMTFTHQFARTLLIEQIYRASEIKKGSGYHK